MTGKTVANRDSAPNKELLTVDETSIFCEPLKLLSGSVASQYAPVTNNEFVEVAALRTYGRYSFKKLAESETILDNTTILVCFKNRSADEEKRIQSRNNKIDELRKKNNRRNADWKSFFTSLSGLVTLFTFLAGFAAVNTAMLVGDLNDDKIIGTVLANVAIVFIIFMVGLYHGHGLEHLPVTMKNILDSKISNSRSRKMQKLAEETPQFAPSDKLFALGEDSLVPQLLKDFETTAPLVQLKLESNPEPAELQSWCATVRKIMELQKPLTNPLPVELIPLRTVEAETTLAMLTDRVTELNEQKMIGEDSFGQLSKATCEGSRSFIDNMTMNDL